MHSGHACYILDANVIRKINYEQLTELIDKRIKIITIDEVYYEVQSLEKVKLIKVQSLCANAFEVMAKLINQYHSVRNIVSYFENKGAADVALLAYCKCSPENRLFEDEKIIITEDKGLRKACDELCIKWMSYIDFLHIK